MSKNNNNKLAESWLLTIRQAAGLLTVSERTINYLIADGAIPSVKIGGARRIWLDDLYQFARGGTNGKPVRTEEQEAVTQ